VRPGFALEEGNAAAVTEICARLDGLPLAVELAASRTKFFSPQAMLAHLGEQQGDRLQFLTGGPRDAPARQRTLRAAIEWSYDLLTPDERTLFSRLSVFSGGCTLEAVDVICADSSSSKPALSLPKGPSALPLLESLVDQSLLRVSRSSPPRFTMLETVREYASERLEESGEAEAMRDRHTAYYTGALEGWGADLKGPRQLEALAEIEADLDNAREAWAWAVERVQVEWLDCALEGRGCAGSTSGEAAMRKARPRVRVLLNAWKRSRELHPLNLSQFWQGTMSGCA
jgi:predicted ATPase